jgi:hypothetical protein
LPPGNAIRNGAGSVKATETSQSTRPQTLAYALTDSPVGQLAWITEKFKEWTDSRDRPEDAVDRDQMLTNVMLYWRPAHPLASTTNERTPTTGARHPNLRRRRPRWPTFRTTTSSPLRHVAERTNNIVQ